MNEPQATTKVDAALIAILTNQPAIFSSGFLCNVEGGLEMAQAIAAFRQELITQYLKQPV